MIISFKIIEPKFANYVVNEARHQDAYEKYVTSFWKKCTDPVPNAETTKCVFEFSGIRVGIGPTQIFLTHPKTTGNPNVGYFKPIELLEELGSQSQKT